MPATVVGTERGSKVIKLIEIFILNKYHFFMEFIFEWWAGKEARNV